jgi:hypothetical protein
MAARNVLLFHIMHNIRRRNTNYSRKYLKCGLCFDYSANVYIIDEKTITRICVVTKVKVQNAIRLLSLKIRLATS